MRTHTPKNPSRQIARSHLYLPCFFPFRSMSEAFARNNPSEKPLQLCLSETTEAELAVTGEAATTLVTPQSVHHHFQSAMQPGFVSSTFPHTTSVQVKSDQYQNVPQSTTAAANSCGPGRETAKAGTDLSSAAPTGEGTQASTGVATACISELGGLAPSSYPFASSGSSISQVLISICCYLQPSYVILVPKSILFHVCIKAATKYVLTLSSIVSPQGLGLH